MLKYNRDNSVAVAFVHNCLKLYEVANKFCLGFLAAFFFLFHQFSRELLDKVG